MKRNLFSKKLSISLIILSVLILNIKKGYAQIDMIEKEQQEELIALSKQKWQWMADKNIRSLENLFHNEAVFVHMGGAMNRQEELSVIKSGGIHYKHAEIKETTVRVINNTAIVLAKIRLTAIVGGNEVINPFIVTEVYLKVDKDWKLGSLSFTRLLGD